MRASLDGLTRPQEAYAEEQQRLRSKADEARQVAAQLDRNTSMHGMWERALLKLQGKLKVRCRASAGGHLAPTSLLGGSLARLTLAGELGANSSAQYTPLDPRPGLPITYADFRALVHAGRVQFLRYANHGQYAAVVLPHQEGGRDGVPNAEEGGGVVYRQHRVEQMPADGWTTDTWRRLNQQLVNVEVYNGNSIAMQVKPTFDTVFVWALRLVVAMVLFRVIDRWLYPIWRPTRLEDRPKGRRKALDVSTDSDLGFLGQSRFVPEAGGGDRRSPPIGAVGGRARFISAEETTGVTFEDFAGQEYVKRELQEVVRILKEAREFDDLGVYCPKGVMLYGPPGTGKTLLARAVAGEAGVPFFSASGSEFVEMFVGVAAARVRDLFVRARQFAPSIVFIDEIDAIGAKRGGTDFGGGGVEREQGLIQILTELDGFQTSNAKVLVIGATNRLDMLDPALLRKGRFDKSVSVGLPTEEGRLAILKVLPHSQPDSGADDCVTASTELASPEMYLTLQEERIHKPSDLILSVHARNKQFNSPAEKERLLVEIASQTDEYSGAELQNVLNEAAILAARQDKDIVERAELLEALKRQEGGFTTGEEDVIDVTGEAKLRIAYREAAVAVLECYLPDPARPFIKTNATEIDTLVNMEYADPKHRHFARKPAIVDAIIRACAPRVIEEMIFGKENMSWMSSAALGEAAQLADYLILNTGMTALGPLTFQTQQDVVTHLGPKIVALRDEYMRYAVEKATAILKEYRSAVETIAEMLSEKDEVSAEEILNAFKRAPRIAQDRIRPVDEYGALVHVGRWGIAGTALPGRATFHPGPVGYATFGAPRLQQTKFISDSTWQLMDEVRERKLQELRDRTEEQEPEPQLIVDGSIL
eukprot:SM000123S25841  [mRNA]  locus=s123:211711:217315:+ [translate_table: standard]